MIAFRLACLHIAHSFFFFSYLRTPAVAARLEIVELEERQNRRICYHCEIMIAQALVIYGFWTPISFLIHVHLVQRDWSHL